jgi:hypothetical protein
MSGLLVQVHRSVGGVDVFVVAPAFRCRCPVGLDDAGGFVVRDLVRPHHIVAIVDLHVAGERPDIAAFTLLLGGDMDRNALIDRGNHLGDRN